MASKMSTARHLRSDSSESNSSHGSSAYQLILDHVLSCPGSYEIPLRTMYTLNSTPRAQPPHAGSNSPSSVGSSPTTPPGEGPAGQTFTDNLITQLSQLPDQPTSLPPSFITSFVRRCFPPALVRVDFPQALTGLDYLKDLETRRRREVAAAMNRLDIDRNTLDSAKDSRLSKDPSIVQWVQSIEDKERKIDALYTQLYIGLRRWILINELSLLPFNRHNCHAMLNTLYPPANTSPPPTTKLTHSILKNQRDGFFKYIQSVEKSGPRILGTLMQQGKATDEDNGWPAVTRTIGLYLQLANSMIYECIEVVAPQSVASPKDRSSKGSSRTSGETKDSNSGYKPTREPRKVDSGVSFNMSEAVSSRSNSIAEPASPSEIVRPETARPLTAKRDPPRPRTPAESVRSTATARPRTNSSARHGTTLERIARGLKTIGRNRTEVTEMILDDTASMAPEKSRLRKMRSLGNLDAHAASKGDLTSMKMPDRKYEAGILSAQKYGTKQSHEI